MSMKAEQGWTIKKIKGKCYLYIWEFDAEATRQKREEMREHMDNGNEKGYTKHDLGTKASRYKWKSLGRVDFKKPSNKLQAFLLDKLDQVPEIQRRVEEMSK